MKKLFTIMALMLAVSAANAQTGIQSVLNQILGSGAASDAVTSILENVVGEAVSNLDLPITGTWKYSKPAVQFKSDNLLAKAGGAAATSKIETALSPLFGKIGMNSSFTYTFNSDSTFTQTIKIGSTVKTLKGTYSLDKTNNAITFQYSVLDKVGMGKLNAIYANTGSSFVLLYDATDLLNFFKKVLTTVSSLTGKTSLAAIVTMVDKYEGVLLGYKMTK